jgi:hypothetical protein
MKEEEYVAILKQKIEKQFDFGESRAWVNGDFIKLSEQITEKTKIYLSPISLKRIFGKVEYNGRPQINTLNALAIFVNYESWKAFIEEEDSKEIKRAPESVKTPSKRRKIIFASVAIAVIVVVAFLVISENKNTILYTFAYTAGQKMAPFNAIVTYDISKIESNNCIIDYGDHFAKDSANISVLHDKNSHVATHTYRYGLVYHPQLIVDGKALATLDIPILTNGWQYVLAKYNENETRSFVPISSLDVEKHQGTMVVMPEVVQKYGIDAISEYFLKYRYVHDFKVGFDDFTCEIKARNSMQKTIVCPEISVFLLGLKGIIRFKIFKPGCGGKWTIVEMGEKKWNGEFRDLSAFGHELDRWRVIKVRVLHGAVAVSVDDKIIFETKIQKELGNFFGVVLDSQGSAEFDYVHVTSSDSVVFSQNFD